MSHPHEQDFQEEYKSDTMDEERMVVTIDTQYPFVGNTGVYTMKTVMNFNDPANLTQAGGTYVKEKDGKIRLQPEGFIDEADDLEDLLDLHPGPILVSDINKERGLRPYIAAYADDSRIDTFRISNAIISYAQNVGLASSNRNNTGTDTTRSNNQPTMYMGTFLTLGIKADVYDFLVAKVRSYESLVRCGEKTGNRKPQYEQGYVWIPSTIKVGGSGRLSLDYVSDMGVISHSDALEAMLAQKRVGTEKSFMGDVTVTLRTSYTMVGDTPVDYNIQFVTNGFQFTGFTHLRRSAGADKNVTVDESKRVTKEAADFLAQFPFDATRSSSVERTNTIGSISQVRPAISAAPTPSQQPPPSAQNQTMPVFSSVSGPQAQQQGYQQPQGQGQAMAYGQPQLGYQQQPPPQPYQQHYAGQAFAPPPAFPPQQPQYAQQGGYRQ